VGRLRAIARAKVPSEAAEENGGRPHAAPGPGRRLLVAIFALILAAAAIAFAVGALGPGTTPVADEPPSPSGSSTPPLTGDPVITAEIPLVEEGGRGGTGGVAVGAGSAWVGVQRGGTSSVVRIDLATNEVVAEIPVEDTPWRKRIAATDEAVWA